nr:MAG TPA: hypothetical protein [Caudoviricetes sp.]
MHPQPDSGVEQRGAELFCSLSVFNQFYLFILMLNKNEKTNNIFCQPSRNQHIRYVAEQ